MDQEELLVSKIRERFASSIEETTVYCGEVTHVVKVDALLDVCRFIKSEKDLKMDWLSDVVGVDYHPRTPRFEVVYHFYSITNKHRLRLKVRIADGENVPTVTDMWGAANWAEREVYDMYGIKFDGHPDMRRIYMAQDWDGYPLRKDYPLRGYKDELNPFGDEKD